MYAIEKRDGDNWVEYGGILFASYMFYSRGHMVLLYHFKDDALREIALMRREDKKQKQTNEYRLRFYKVDDCGIEGG